MCGCPRTAELVTLLRPGSAAGADNDRSDPVSVGVRSDLGGPGDWREKVVKLIVAVVKPHRVDEVLAAVHALNIGGLTLTEARGHGRQRGHTEVYRGAEYQVDLVPKSKLEILVDDGEVDKVVNAIVHAAQTGKIGDGKVWTVPVEDVVRVRTEERGIGAIR